MGKKKNLDSMPPYVVLRDTLKETTAFLDKEMLELEGVVIYEGMYRDAVGNQITIPMLPTKVYRIPNKMDIAATLVTVDLLNYFKKHPCGVDIKWAHELYISIKEYGTTNFQPTRVYRRCSGTNASIHHS